MLILIQLISLWAATLSPYGCIYTKAHKRSLVMIMLSFTAATVLKGVKFDVPVFHSKTSVQVELAIVPNPLRVCDNVEEYRGHPCRRRVYPHGEKHVPDAAAGGSDQDEYAEEEASDSDAYIFDEQFRVANVLVVPLL